jgi:hypothetical protein
VGRRYSKNGQRVPFGSSTHACGMAQGTYSYAMKSAAKRRKAQEE